MRRQIRLGDHLVGIGHGETNNPSPFSGLHARRNGPRHIKYRIQIVGQHVLPASRSLFENVHAMIRTSSVDQGIDRSKLHLHLLGKRRSLIRDRNITSFG